MGETVNLRNPLAGTFSLNDFIQQGDSAATVQRLLKLILPTVDLKDFRRRFRVDRPSVNLQIGERVSDIRWTVPRGEAWHPLAVAFENGDSADHALVAKTTLMRGGTIGGTVLLPMGVSVVSGFVTKIIWPLTVDNQSSSGIQSLFDFVLEPGDSFVVEDTTIAVNGTAVRFMFVYEQVPQPAQTRTQGVRAVPTVT